MDGSWIKICKSLLRNKLKHSLLTLSPSARRVKSKKIIKCLLGSSFFRKAQNIVIYFPLPGEVDTRPLIDRALFLNKNVFLPRVHPARGALEVFQIRDSSKELKKGYCGIREPRASQFFKGRPQKMDLIIVPGLGFDKSGRRLGRGEGHFDRFLRKTIRATKIGLAFKEQVLTKIPADARDVRVDKIITD